MAKATAKEIEVTKTEEIVELVIEKKEAQALRSLLGNTPSGVLTASGLRGVYEALQPITEIETSSFTVTEEDY